VEPKRGEPQGRQRVAIHAQGSGGVNRRGGGKPRGRNMGAPWQVHPDGGPARGHREWTPVFVVRRRGDLWTIPREAVHLGDRMGRRIGRCRERRRRRSGGFRTWCFTHAWPARARILEGEPTCASAEVNARRVAGKPISTTSFGYLPPSRPRSPQGVGGGGDGAREASHQEGCAPQGARSERRDDETLKAR